MGEALVEAEALKLEELSGVTRCGFASRRSVGVGVFQGGGWQVHGGEGVTSQMLMIRARELPLIGTFD